MILFTQKEFQLYAMQWRIIISTPLSSVIHKVFFIFPEFGTNRTNACTSFFYKKTAKAFCLQTNYSTYHNVISKSFGMTTLMMQYNYLLQMQFLPQPK